MNRINPGEIIAYCVLGALLISVVFLSENKGLEASSLKAEIAFLKEESKRRTIPHIYIARNDKIYSAEGELVIEQSNSKH